MEHSLLTDLLIVIAAASFFAVIFERLRLPGLLGLLLAGSFLGPSGFKILSDPRKIQGMAEMGVALLMLTIGLEFSFERVRKLFKTAFLGGGLQIFASIGIAMLIAWKLHWTFYQGFVLGSVMALSSTAIVIKYLMDRAELDTLHGRIAFAILVFQDLAVPFLLILITGLYGSGQAVGLGLAKAGLKAALLFFWVFVLAKFMIFPLLRRVAQIRNREILFLISISICLAIACAAQSLGLSFAIGAFLAGLALANTDFGFHFIGELQPFRHLFVSIFFVSIGLLFDPVFAFHHAGMLVLIVGTVLFINIVVVTSIAIALGYSPRVAIAAGLLLCQIGEFSFVLVQAAKQTGGISEEFYQLIIGASFITLFLSPVLFAAIPRVMRYFETRGFLGLRPGQSDNEGSTLPRSGHVIVCGYGAVGRDICQALQAESIPLVVIEMNPALLDRARKTGLSVIAGDCANLEVLSRAGIAGAKAAVISFGDSLGTVHTLNAMRRLSQTLYIVLRTRYEVEIAGMYEKGADLVVLEEWEASLQLNQSILHYFKLPPERVQQAIKKIRDQQELKSEELILKRLM